MITQSYRLPGFFGIEHEFEFIVVGDEILFAKGDLSWHPLKDIDVSILAMIQMDLEENPNAEKALDEMNFKDPIERISQYIKCNMGDYDNQVDITHDGILHKEHVHCSARGTCKYEGKLCLNFFPAKNGNLTEREIQVIELTAAGFGNKQIAAEFGRKISTVASHVTSIERKTGCPTKPAIVAYAFQHNLIR